MKINKKISLYFSGFIIPTIGVVFFIIYNLFYEYREEEFQKQQKKKITSTLRFLTEIKQIDDNLIHAMDSLTIHDFYDEKLLIFNERKELIYSSIDDTPIPIAQKILNELSANKQWIETKEDLYDVIGVYVDNKGNEYYGISKAYDNFGYSKMNFLKYTLMASFFIISLLIIVIAYYLSNRISYSIVDITNQIRKYDFEGSYKPIRTRKSNDEIAILTNWFNQLLERMYNAFSFQKHAIHHISHELKTPIAILVSNLERIEKETDINTILTLIKDQKEDTKNLGDIINALLEISKTDAENMTKTRPVRIDDLVYDIVDELRILNEDFYFEVSIKGDISEEKDLMVMANDRLLKAAIMNLAVNCVQYSIDQHAKIVITFCQQMINLEFINHGPVISDTEKQYLFQHFFRGNNSAGKRGFGLGLVLINKIIGLHHGTIRYINPDSNTNIFIINLPLS